MTDGESKDSPFFMLNCDQFPKIACKSKGEMIL